MLRKSVQTRNKVHGKHLVLVRNFASMVTYFGCLHARSVQDGPSNKKFWGKLSSIIFCKP